MLSLDASDSVAQAIAGGQPSVTPAPDSSPAAPVDRSLVSSRVGRSLARAATPRRFKPIVRPCRPIRRTRTRLNNLGWSLGVLGFFDLAVPALERAVVVAPRSALARNNLAWGRAMLAHANASATIAR